MIHSIKLIYSIIYLSYYLRAEYLSRLTICNLYGRPCSSMDSLVSSLFLKLMPLAYLSSKLHFLGVLVFFVPPMKHYYTDCKSLKNLYGVFLQTTRHCIGCILKEHASDRSHIICDWINIDYFVKLLDSPYALQI